MLPDIRFAIGAVLASALLIVSAFGLAATVRVAHHRAVGPLEVSRILAYSDPADWVSGPGMRPRIGDIGIDAAGDNSLLERIAAIPLDPDATRFIGGTGDRAPPDDPASLDTTEAIEARPGTPAGSNIEPITAAAAPPNASAAETDRGAYVAALPAAAEESTTAEPRAELSQAAVAPVPAKKASAKANSVRKKVVKKRRLPARAPAQANVRPPTATTGYPVRDDGAVFGGWIFDNTSTATRPNPTCEEDAWHCR